MPRKPTSKSRPRSRSASTGKPEARARAARGTEISPDWPTWYHPDSPLGSAVRYVASLSPRYNWVGIYRLKGKVLELGPYIGAKTDHTRIPVGRGVCGTAVSENADQNVPDVRSLENYLACSLETKSELVVLVRDKAGRILGQIDIDSHTPSAFGKADEEAVRKVARELGELWPA
jgi:L-methionine (R)-S-oxide reductase